MGLYNPATKNGTPLGLQGSSSITDIFFGVEFWSYFTFIQKIQFVESDQFLAGGLKYFFYFHPDPWGNDPNLTNIQKMGWIH